MQDGFIWLLGPECKLSTASVVAVPGSHGLHHSLRSSASPASAVKVYESLTDYEEAPLV